MVVIARPAMAVAGSMQERAGSPSTSTVQVPHWPMPQLYLVPVRFSTSRKAQSRGMSGGTSTA